MPTMFPSETMGAHNFLTFLLQYSVVQGVLLAVFLLVKNRQHYLSFLLLSVSYLVFIYLFERFQWFMEFPYLLWTNVPFWFTIGPLFFLYGRSLFRTGSPFRKTDLLHFIPVLAVIVTFSGFYFQFGASEKIDNYLAMFGNDYNFDYMQLAYIAQMLIYGYIGLKMTRSKISTLKTQQSDSSHIHLGFLKNIYTGLGLYAICALVLAIILFAYQDAYASLLQYYAFVFLALTSIVHFSTYHLLVYQRPMRRTVAPKQQKAQRPTGRYASSSLDQEQMKALLQQLKERIKSHEDYKNPNLRLSDLAIELNVPSHHISQCLNQELGKNFFDFINEYRVEAVKQHLTDPKFKNYTLFAIASEVGFNSHSSFYRIFKKTTGMTPKAYIDSTQSSQ